MSEQQAAMTEPPFAPPGYTIRPAARKDLDRLEELYLALQAHLEASNSDVWQKSQESRHALRAQIANRLQGGEGLTLVAEHATDGVVGVVNGRVVTNNRYVPARAGSIDQAFVRADHRRGGVGAALVATLCRFFASEGVDELSLRYVVGNEEADSFWTALGFRPRIVTAGAARARVEERLASTPEEARP
ncbi:MAG: GNAT family N-acetyltransferase [Anaerolineae bacterium]|jgi:GNAT superfamily N-acetyltransferase